jgi:Domain of unknown function (DUF4394)
VKFVFCRKLAGFARDAFVVASALWSLSAQASVLYAFDSVNKNLLLVNVAAPGTVIRTVPVLGLAANDVLVGLDTRPIDGSLYAITLNASQLRVATINPASGTLTAVGTAATSAPGNAFGMAFNPLFDAIRVTSEFGNNYRFNPSTGALIAEDNSVGYQSGDPNFGQLVSAVHLAHASPVANGQPSALFGIDTANNVLARIGGASGTPSPNTGIATTIGALGVDPTAVGGFVVLADGRAFAALQVGTTSSLYSINLATGAATLVGAFPSGTQIEGLAIRQVDRCLDVDGDGRVLATTDGVLITRIALGLTGTAVTDNALPTPLPPRATWEAIRTHLNDNCGLILAP